VKAKKPRQFGKIIAAVADTTRNARQGEDAMIDLIVSAFGAKPADNKRLETLARNLLPSHATRLRRMGRASVCEAEHLAERAYLVEEAGRQRRARAARHRHNAYGPPMAQRQEYEGTVNIAGRPGAPSRGGYRPAKDLANLANLTEMQRKFAAEFIGRPLGPITVWPIGAGSPRVVDLGRLWSSVASRSKTVEQQMKQAAALMKQFEAKSKECARLLSDAAAAGVTDKAVARRLRTQAIDAAKAADQFRRQAKKFGDDAYSNVRNAFWSEVHRQPDLVEHFTKNMGLQFLSDGPRGLRGAPFYQLPAGGREGLTLEHFARRSDDPRLAVEPGNLIVSPTTENVLLNEAIRNYAPQQFSR
jgi:hypothetical protein